MEKNSDLRNLRYNEHRHFASPLALRYIGSPLYCIELLMIQKVENPPSKGSFSFGALVRSPTLSSLYLKPKYIL